MGFFFVITSSNKMIMPDKSSRAQALDELYHMRKRILIEGDSDSDAVEEAMEENLALNLAIQ